MGDLAGARTLCEEIVISQPAHFDTRFLLSVIALKTGDPGRSVDLIANAIGTAPDNFQARLAYLHLGAGLRRLGKLHEAIASYDKAIAIDERHADAYLGRGNVQQQLGQSSAALASYERAITLKSDYAEAHCNRGVVLAELKQSDAALASFNRAIAIRPDYAEAYWNRGMVLQERNQLGAALDSCNQAIALSPHSEKAHYNRGNVLLELNNLEMALESYNRAISINKDYAFALSGRGTTFRELNQFEAALADYERAIEIKPNFAAAYSNRGTAQLRMGRLNAALESYNKAIAIDPESGQAHMSRAHARLLAGDFENGWVDFEWRWKFGDGLFDRERRKFRKPAWSGGEPLCGKTILLHSEQGLGDTLQFCRYASIVAQMGARVILETPAPLKTLLASVEGVACLVEDGGILPDFHYHCPLLSLPLALNTTLSTIPARVPYLQAQGQKVLDWKERLGEKRKLRVGLTWSGGFRPEQPKLWAVNRRRNVPLEKLASLKHPDIEYYTLQKGQPAESELSRLVSVRWGGPHLIDFTHLLHDFSDTAALVENLDLVISVDTSTVHLAGALGKPVWIMNRFDTCWRWLVDRTDSPWYPTARLYRQQRAGDWDSVVQEIRQDLWRLASRAPKSPMSA
jgi:tetratricopeptide (TPR) repeat protein